MRTRAFGMDVETGFDMPGVDAGHHASDGRALTIRLADRGEVEKGFPDSARRITELRFDDGRVAVSIDDAGDWGYRAFAFDFGCARLRRDGRDAAVAPLDEPPWIWQRYLTGQLLPLAALLQGLEVFHAAVLEFEGRAIAVAAHSGGGKTTTALHLVRRGLGFMSDDVLVLEPDGIGARAHPGIGLANLRPGADSLLAQLEREDLARPIGRDERETRIAVRRSSRALPLSALFFLNRYSKERALEVERLTPVDPRLLLAATFNLAIRAPERLARQLDVCARIDRTATLFRVSFGASGGDEEVADAILRELDV